MHKTIVTLAALLTLAAGVWACDSDPTQFGRPYQDVALDVAYGLDAALDADAEAPFDVMERRDGDVQIEGDIARLDVARLDADAALIDAAASWPYVAGQSYFSETGYIEFIAGDNAVIVSAAHGGYLKPDDIPERTGLVLRDHNTQELSREFAEALFEATGRRPHVIINLLARSKLDANRELEDAAQGNAVAEAAWHEFHAFIDEAKDFAVENYSRALYLDVHGHSHEIERVELGYLLSANDLRRSDAVLDEARYSEASSVRRLAEDSAERLSFSQLVRGPTSFGAYLEARDFPSVPSPSQPAPASGDAYFSGGDNTRRHGSRDGGLVSGLQLEVNRSVRFSDSALLAFAKAMAAASAAYLAEHFQIVD